MDKTFFGLNLDHLNELDKIKEIVINSNVIYNLFNCNEYIFYGTKYQLNDICNKISRINKYIEFTIITIKYYVNNYVNYINDNTTLICISENNKYGLIYQNNKEKIVKINLNTKLIFDIANFTLTNDQNIINLEKSELIVFTIHDTKYAIKKPNLSNIKSGIILYRCNCGRGKFINSENFSFNMNIQKNGNVVFFAENEITNERYKWKDAKFVGIQYYNNELFIVADYDHWGYGDENNTIVFTILTYIKTNYDSNLGKFTY